MSDPASDAPPAHSVLDLIARRTGEAPHVKLREEDSGASPMIDPRSQEKLALPQGRCTSPGP